MSDLLQITDQNFETEVLNSDIPVLVDFWAEWCAPCKALMPLLAKITEEYQGELLLAELGSTPPATDAQTAVANLELFGAAADKDGDGDISYMEFIKLMTSK